MVLEDFVMLGKTVPEPARDGRVFVCSAGVSRELRQLVRIYPLALGGCPPRWMTCRVTVERNPRDSRAASWCLAGDRSVDIHPTINYRIRQLDQVAVEHRADLLQPHVVGSIAEANARRLSLALLEPDEVPELEFRHNPHSEDSPQMRLFDDPAKPPVSGSRRFAFNPYLMFHDESAVHHLQLRDWGCYEFLRKQGDARRHDLLGALHLSPDSSLLVGNFNAHRNAWCVISVLQHVRRPEPLFELAEVS